MRQAAKQNQFGQQHQRQHNPNAEFPGAEAALTGGGKPELNANRAEADDIAIAKALAGGNGLEIHREGGIRVLTDLHTVVRLKFQGEMPVPHPGIVQNQMTLIGPANIKRKAADRNATARRFARKYIQLNHHHQDFLTSIWSPG